MYKLALKIVIMVMCSNLYAYSEDIKHEYYEVQVGNSMPTPSYVKQFAPQCNKYEKGVGCFQWTIRTKYDWIKNKKGCTLTRPHLQLAGVMILPRFTTDDPVIEKKLEAFSRDLVVHEEGHAEIGRSAVKEFESEILNIGTKNTCEDLKSSVLFERDLIIQKANLQNAIYDKETGHGETQGAILIR